MVIQKNLTYLLSLFPSLTISLNTAGAQWTVSIDEMDWRVSGPLSMGHGFLSVSEDSNIQPNFPVSLTSKRIMFV